MKKRIISLLIALTLAITPTAVSAAATTKNEIEYVKQTFIKSDGSTDSIQETWYNQKTNDKREDFRIPDSKDKDSYVSNYVKENGKQWITINRNTKGEKVSGTIMQMDAKEAKSIVESNKQYTFAAVKEEYTDSAWKSAGTTKDKEGRTLNKLSKTIKLKVKKNGSKNLTIDGIEYAYIDKSTGLPVKREYYQKTKGKQVLQYTYVIEFDTIQNKTSIFDTSGVDLEKIKPVDLSKGVG